MAGAAGIELSPGDHVVQFYRHDHELAERTGSYLLTALQAGGSVIVIATAAHRFAFEAHLRQAGLDPRQAELSGRYLPFDASTTMREFMVAGRPEPGRFAAVIGALVRQACLAGRPVHAYGEMVTLLWEAGLVSAAIDVEAMWNDLGWQYPFALLCAYPAQSVTGGERATALAETCRLHTAVLGAPPQPAPQPEAAQARAFPASLHAPGEARRFVLAALRRWGGERSASDAAIVVTELSTNAVLHAHSAFTVEISAAAGALRIEVRDADPLPQPVPGQGQAPLPVAPTHGLGVVTALATAWGADPLPGGGKAVWAELRR
ncbi:MAG TPA: MEDS domain-containing protein [Streptosporangiaceae bacterium]|jgi:anti-sigma regulatory factor (Ser/Thr protein kinase)